MKIALIGFGNMGKELARLIEEDTRYELVSASFKNGNRKLDILGIKRADVAIDFTQADAVLNTIEEIIKLKVPIVIGTTGWYQHLPRVKQLVQKAKSGLIYGQNFSIGANVFFQILSYGTKLINQFPEYDIYGYEIHHSNKKDSPSGTAKKISSIVLENVKRKKVLQSERLDRKINPNEFHVVSIRGGRNPGFHEITFDSIADDIKISHQAHGRTGFAKGALMAAEFIKNKKGIFTFEEIFERQVKQNE